MPRSSLTEQLHLHNSMRPSSRRRLQASRQLCRRGVRAFRLCVFTGYGLSMKRSPVNTTRCHVILADFCWLGHQQLGVRRHTSAAWLPAPAAGGVAAWPPRTIHWRARPRLLIAPACTRQRSNSLLSGQQGLRLSPVGAGVHLQLRRVVSGALQHLRRPCLSTRTAPARVVGIPAAAGGAPHRMSAAQHGRGWCTEACDCTPRCLCS